MRGLNIVFRRGDGRCEMCISFAFRYCYLGAVLLNHGVNDILIVNVWLTIRTNAYRKLASWNKRKCN